MKKRAGATLAALAVIAQSLCVFSAKAEAGGTKNGAADVSYRGASYEAYLNTYNTAARPNLSIAVPVADFTATGEGTHLEPALDGRSNVLITGSDGAVSWALPSAAGGPV